MRVGYFYKKDTTHAWNGAPLQQYDLKTVLDWLPQLPKDHEKNSMGSMYFHTNNVVGVEHNPVSDGIMGCDIDRISKEDCDRIINGFDDLALVFPCLVACWYSHSYYNEDRPYGGLHLVMKADVDELVYDTTGEENHNSYRRYNTLYSAMLARVIYKVCGVDVRPFYRPEYGKDGGIDSAMKSIGQKCYLNYSSVVRWNENIFNVTFSEDVITELKKWFIGYRWFESEDEFKTVSAVVKRFEGRNIISRGFKPKEDAFGEENQVGHRRRIAVENFLAGLGWEKDDIVEFVYRICFGDDFREGEHNLKKAISQTTKTAISKYRGKPSAFYTERARDILTALGVDIEVEVEKVYRPFEYHFDPVFEGVWEEHKDDVVWNTHYYGPREKVDKFIHLKKDEHLSDHMREITDFISEHDMTYLVADCMTGKTYLSLVVDKEKKGLTLFDDCMIMRVDGHNVDLCVPYNSVADNKAKNDRKDIRRVVTQNIKSFDEKKRNIFIWNTIKPLYDKYFSLGMVKRFILFFDESQKIVTDDYRWETVFEMFKALPMMYKHVVFMTGTPAYELDYLKQFFPDYGIIKVEKENKYEREYHMLEYDSFSNEDRVELIEREIEDGHLPLIYSNTKNREWKLAIKKVNMKRVDLGLKPLRVLEYERDNSDNLNVVNQTNSIKKYDIVIATAYCSVGIDFKKDDERQRVSIVDYANERNCGFLDIWQFTLRNRDQDTVTKGIHLKGKENDKRLYNYAWTLDYCDRMSKIHTHKGDLEVAEDLDIGKLINTLYREKKLGKMVENGCFEDDRNVTLLASYYKSKTLFGNPEMIRHMMEVRGVKVKRIDMTHTKGKKDDTVRKDVYRFFVDNFNEISEIQMVRGVYDRRCHYIPLDDNGTERIENGKVYSRETKYMSFLIRSFAGKEEWLPILKDRDYMSPQMFVEYNKMSNIVKNTTKEQLHTFKRMKGLEGALDYIIGLMIPKMYKNCGVDGEDFVSELIFKEMFETMKQEIMFIVDNMELIEEIKSMRDEGERITAVHKMMIVMEQKELKRIRKRQSEGGRMNAKTVTAKNKLNGKVKTYDSVEDFCAENGVSKYVYYKLKRGIPTILSERVQLIDMQ